jgi:predicted enzyme related to lactoylglutathione lyase
MAPVGERTSHAPGTFSWVDAATTDLDGATTFYEGLLGWEHVDAPIGDGSVYRMFQLDGKHVAAAGEQRQEERSHGIPPHWNNYVTVASADDTATRVKDLGGNLMMDPFDVFDSGRMTVFSDPTGAILSIWEPREHIGAGIVNEPGALTWNELSTTDVEQAKRFYADLFGWSFEDVGTAESPYTMIRNGDRMNGGIRPLGDPEQQAGTPPNWMPYLVSADIERSAARAGELKGTVMVGPMEVQPGRRIVVARDPQGAVFGLFEGETED